MTIKQEPTTRHSYSINVLDTIHVTAFRVGTARTKLNNSHKTQNVLKLKTIIS